MAKKKETDGIPMLMEAPSTGLTVPSSFKIGDQSYNKETLIAQRDKDVKLVITGVDDREGYKQAVTLRGQYRTLRTTLEKVRKEHFKPMQEYLKDYKAKTDELGAEAAIGEDYFDEMITAIDDEKQRIKDEAEKEAQRKLQGRINELTALDAKFDGEMYHFDYDESQFVSAFLLKDYSDVEFSEILSDIQAAYEVEQKRLADEKQRLEDEAEAKRLADIAIAEQAEQNKQDALALTERRTKLRIKELQMLGYSILKGVSGSDYFSAEHETIPIVVGKHHVEENDDTFWDELITSIENYTPPVIETAPTEPIADVQGTETSNQVTEDQWTEEYTGTQGNDVVDANNVIIESDYSLNEFEKFIQQYFKGTEKVKQQFMLAISEYKGLMDKM